MRLATWWIAWASLLVVWPPLGPAQEKQIQKSDSGQPRIIPVWPKDAPGSEKWTQKEVEHHDALLRVEIVRNVVRPTLTAFLPERSKANGTAVVICPGGGFFFWPRARASTKRKGSVPAA